MRERDRFRHLLPMDDEPRPSSWWFKLSGALAVLTVGLLVASRFL